MSKQMSMTYVGGTGSIKNSRGSFGKGLRNKRKAYWSKIHMAELKERIRKAKEERYNRNDEYRY